MPATQPKSLQRRLTYFVIGTFCVVSSYALGKTTAGSVQPFTLIEAGGTQVAGDMDGNSRVDIDDVIIILEAVQQYRRLTPEQFRADPNNDGNSTVDDALRLLKSLANN